MKPGTNHQQSQAAFRAQPPVAGGKRGSADGEGSKDNQDYGTQRDLQYAAQGHREKVGQDKKRGTAIKSRARF